MKSILWFVCSVSWSWTEISAPILQKKFFCWSYQPQYIAWLKCACRLSGKSNILHLRCINIQENETVLKNCSQESVIKINVAHVLSRLYVNWAFPRSCSSLTIPLPRHSCYWYTVVVLYPIEFLSAVFCTIMFFRRWPIHGLHHCQLFTHQERQNKANFPSQAR